MAKLFYHVSLLETAMADMQRAVNSKRSIAEIALTRMCDPKLSASAESLALRVEELERELSLLKLGAPTYVAGHKEETEKKKDIKPKAEAVFVEEKPKNDEKPKEISHTLAPYKGWQSVLERIGELRVSLSAQFLGSSVMRSGNVFNIKMSDFFAKKIASSPEDIELVRGVISEIEKIQKSDIKINVSSMSAPDSDLAAELDNLFG